MWCRFADSEELVRKSGLPASSLVEVGDNHGCANALSSLLEPPGGEVAANDGPA